MLKAFEYARGTNAKPVLKSVLLHLDRVAGRWLLQRRRMPCGVSRVGVASLPVELSSSSPFAVRSLKVICYAQQIRIVFISNSILR